MIKLVAVGLTGLLAAACVPTTSQSWLTQPADPRLGISSPRYSNVTAGVKPFGVVEPKDWRQLNQQVTPGEMPAPGESTAGSARRGR